MARNLTNVIVIFFITGAIAPRVLCGSDSKTSAPFWEKQMSEEILAVVNVDGDRMKLQGPSAEDVVLTGSPIGGEPGQSPFQILGTGSGVLLVAARDKSKFVQLIALNVDTGEKLWQVPCTNLPVADLIKTEGARTHQIVSSFLVGRNQVATVQLSDEGKSEGGGSRELVSYDLKTGAELWRAGGVGGGPADMMRQMLKNQKGFSGAMMKRALKNIDKMMPQVSTYQTLPQKGLVLKLSPDPGGLGLEAMDWDTGQFAWNIRFNLVIPDIRQINKTPSAKEMREMTKHASPGKMPDVMPIQNWIRGDFLIFGCQGAISEASLGSGQCTTLRAYNLSNGQTAWEFQEGSQDVMGWMPAREIILVRLPKKVVAVKLETGEKLYEISDQRVPLLAGVFAGRVYADGDQLFWFDLKSGDNKLTAMEIGSGKILWSVPTSRSRIVSFVAREKALVIGGESEMIFLERTSGTEVARQKPLGSGTIRNIAALDSRRVSVVGDKQVAQYEVDPLKEIYRVSIPEPKRSIWGDLILIGLAAAVASSQPNGPIAANAAGQMLGSRLGDLLFNRSNASSQELARQSSNYCYFNSGGAVQRIEMATGKLEEVRDLPSKGGVLALDESYGVACLVQNRKIACFRVAVDDKARRTARYLNALDLGHREMRRGSKLEAGDPSKAVAAYRAASSSLGDALMTGGDAREKAVVHLALGRAHERLSVLAAQESDSWKAKAREDYGAARALTCNSDVLDLQDLCGTARELQDGLKP